MATGAGIPEPLQEKVTQDAGHLHDTNNNVRRNSKVQEETGLIRYGQSRAQFTKEALEHLNGQSNVIEKCDDTESGARQNMQIVCPNPSYDALTATEETSILHETGAIIDSGPHFYEETQFKEENEMSDANTLTQDDLREDIQENEDEVNRKHLPEGEMIDLSISIFPNDISEEPRSERKTYREHERSPKLSFEETNDRENDVELKVPSAHPSLHISDIEFWGMEKNNEGSSSRGNLGIDEESHKTENKNVTDEAAKVNTDTLSDKITTEEVTVKYENEGQNKKTGEKLGIEVEEDKIMGKEVRRSEHDDRPISELTEGKVSENSTVHLDDQSLETTDGIEVVVKDISTEDEETKKTNVVLSKEDCPQNGKSFGQKHDKGNLASDEYNFNIADTEDHTENEPKVRETSNENVMFVAEEKILDETDQQNQFELTTPELDKRVHEVNEQSEVTENEPSGYEIADQSLYAASVSDAPVKQTLQTDDLMNGHPVKNSELVLDGHILEIIITTQIAEKNGASSTMAVSEGHESTAAKKYDDLQHLGDKSEERKLENTKDLVPQKIDRIESEDRSNSKESKSTENQSIVTDSISTCTSKYESNVVMDAEILEKNAIQLHETTYSRDETVDEVMKEEGTDNGNSRFSSAAPLTETAFPLNAEERGEHNEIPKVPVDEGLCEKVQEKDDVDSQSAECDILNLSENQVEEDVNKNETGNGTSTDNIQLHEKRHAENGNGQTNYQSNNDDFDSSSMAEASERGKEIGAPDAMTEEHYNHKTNDGSSQNQCKDEPENGSCESHLIALSSKLEETGGNRNPEKKNTDVEDLVLKVEKSHKDKDIYEVEKLDIEESTQDGKKYKVEQVAENLMHECQIPHSVDLKDATDEDFLNKSINGTYNTCELSLRYIHDGLHDKHEDAPDDSCEEQILETTNNRDTMEIIEHKEWICPKLALVMESVPKDENKETTTEMEAVKIKNTNYYDDDLNKDENNINRILGNDPENYRLVSQKQYDVDGEKHEEQPICMTEEEIHPHNKVKIESYVHVEQTESGKLDFASGLVPEDWSQEVAGESEVTMIDITDLSSDPEATMAKDKENLNENTDEILDSQVSVVQTIYKYEEDSKSVCEVGIHQAMKTEDNNEVYIEGEKSDSENIEIIAEPILQNQIEEINCESEALSVHDLTEDYHPHKNQIIEMINLNDDPETAKVKDKDDHESIGNISGSHKLVEGTIDDRVGKRHGEITNFVCQEEIHQKRNTEDNNEIDPREENLEAEKLEIIPEPVCEDLIEETNEPEGINIHDSTDNVNPYKKQITEMVNLDDHAETANVKNEDKKENNIRDICGSHKLVEATIHKQYNETTNSVCEEEIHQISNTEDNYEVGIQDKKKDTQNLEIISKVVPGVYTEEINGESEEINIHYSTDDAGLDKKITEMVNLNDDIETATVKVGDNQEKNMSDILDIYKLVDATMHEKIAKQHGDTTSLVFEEEIHQITNTEENNEVEIQEVKMETENFENISKTVTEDHIEKTKGEPEAIDNYDSTDDADPDKKHLNDEPENTKINDMANCEKNTSAVSYAHKLVKPIIHDQIGKKHDNTGKFLFDEEASLIKNIGDNDEVDIQKEETVAEKLEIISKLVPEEQEKEANVEPEAINIHNSTDDANPDKKITEMVNLNDDIEVVKVKDENIKENNTSGKLVEDTIHKRVGKQRDETANSLCEDIHEITNTEDKNEVDIKEDKIDIQLLAVSSKPLLEDQIKEANGESEAINIENSTEDVNADKKIREAESLIDDTETAKVKNEDNQENKTSDTSDAHNLVEDKMDDGIGKQHDETTNFVCDETRQITNTKDINEVDIQEAKTETKIISELVPVNQIEETKCEPEEIHILDSINNADKKITKKVNLNDASENAEVMDDDMIHDTVSKQHEETTNSLCEEEIHQIADTKYNIKVSMHKEGTDVKKFEVISDRLPEDHSQDMAYERETTKIKTTLGDYSSRKQTACLTTSKTLIEDKIQKEGPVPDLASSELRENMDNRILEKDRTSETSELCCKENMVEKAYEFESQEKPKDTSKIESRDEERQRKEESSDKIIEKPSPATTEGHEVSAEVLSKREIIGEDRETTGDDSVSTRCEMIEDTFQKKEENQMTEETPEIANRGQDDETNKVNDTKKNIDHLNEQNENSTDRNENRDQRPDDLTVATASKAEASFHKNQRITPNKPDNIVDKDFYDLTSITLNLEAWTETEPDKIKKLEDGNYDNVNTEALKSINEESIDRSFDKPPVLPELVGELSDVLKYNHEKTSDAPHEEQICNGVAGKIGIDSGTKVVEEDKAEGAASQYTIEEMTNKRNFSAEGNDYSHEVREVTRNSEGTLLEEYETAQEGASMSGKQSQATTVDKLNLEFGLISEEKLKTLEFEENQESDTSGKEEGLDACIGSFSNVTSEEPSVVVELELPLKEIINAEAVKGIDKGVEGSNLISQENFETRAGTRSNEVENENERNCDPVDDSLYAKEASDHRKIQKKASDKEFEGLVTDIAKESDIEILESETSEKQDACMNLETDEVEEETQDKGNKIQQEKKVSEETKTLETDKLEDVGLENNFNGVPEVLQTEHSNDNTEKLEKEARDDTQENENKEPKAIAGSGPINHCSKLVTVSDTSDDAISQEPARALKSMFACEEQENTDTINEGNPENADATNEKTSEKVDDLSATDNLGGETISGEVSGFRLQMEKIEFATLISEDKFQNIGTGDEETQEKNEELNLKLQKYAKEIIKLDDPLNIVLEGVETTELGEKTEKNIIAGEDVMDDPDSFKEETAHEHYQKDEIEAEKNKKPKTKQKDTNDTTVKEFDCMPSEENPLAEKPETESQINEDEKKNLYAIPNAYTKYETVHERLQKGDVGAKNKQEEEAELKTADIMAHECLNTEVIELVHRPSQYNLTMTSLNEKIETASLVDLEGDENLDSDPGSCMKNIITHEQLRVEKNKEPQTKWEIERTDTNVNESSDDKVKEFDCKPSEEKSVTAVFAEKIETVLTLDVERFQKYDIEAMKNKEPETGWETETTNTMADDPPNDEVKEYHGSPSEENSTMAVMTEKIEKALVLENKDGNKNLVVPSNSCVKDEIMHEKVQSDEIQKNKEPQNSHEQETNDFAENESPKNEVKDLVCMSSEQDSLWTFLTEKIEAALLMDELDHEKKNLDVGLAACIKDEIANEQFQKGKIELDKAKEQHIESEPNKTDMANGTPNDEVKEFDIIPSEENSNTRVSSETIGTRLPISEEDDKKNFDGGPDSRVKDEIGHEQFKKDEFEAQKSKELQAKWETEATNTMENQPPNHEVKNLDCESSEQNSIMVFLTEKTETGILMDEDDENKNLSALSHVSTPEEQTMQEVVQENEVLDFTLSKATQNEEVIVELTTVTSYGKGSAEVDKLDTSNDSTSINTNDIALKVNVRDEEVPKSILNAVVLSEDSRIGTLNQDKEMTGEASNLVSKIEGDEMNHFSVKATENEKKSNKLSMEQTVEVRSPTERKRVQQKKQTSNEVIDFNYSQDEEKYEDLGDLPVSRLLFEHILRNIVDTNDKILDAVSEDNGASIQNQVGNSVSLPAEEVIEETSTPEKRAEADKKFEDTSDLLHGGSPHVKENITEAIVKEDERSQSFLHYSSPSLAKSKNIMDNEVIPKHGGISGVLPTEEAKQETRISEDKEGPEKLHNTSASVIEVKCDTMGNAENAAVKDDEKHNNHHDWPPILQMGESVKYEVSGLQYEVSTRDGRNENEKMTPIEKSVPGSIVDSGYSHPEQDQTNLVKLAGDTEKLNKDLDVSSITEGSSDDVLQKEGKEDGKVTLEELGIINNTFHATEEKILSVSEPIGHTKNILQGKETLPNSQYNQTEESYKCSVAENPKQEETVEIELEVKEKEIGEEIPDEITKRVQNVNEYSFEEPEESNQNKDHQSNLVLETTNGTVQITESSAISEEAEKQTKEAIHTQIEEEKTDEDRDEKEGEHIIEEFGKDVPVNMEARDANSMQAHKKSHNILSGVGSKVKHSLAKVRKAIKGKSSHPKVTSAK